MTNENQVKYLNEKQVSCLTGMAVQTLRNWRFRGVGFPYSKVGSAIRYSWPDVIGFMDNHKVKTEN